MLRFVPGSENRRDAIREILLAEKVADQKDLLRQLAGRGIRVTQPVVSRDLRALKAAKREGAYTLPEEERVTPLTSLRSLLRGAKPAGSHLVVVRCEPGAASAVARALEAEALPGLVGTVAGDDTIFAAVSSETAGRKIRRRVLELL